ncbi:MAG: hypothetical protein EXS63_06340 [Candidatus Omnitrophica bacterium]|nr:hypothetical protein [Candidatus Omnitrophota bacterium]
MSRFFVYQKGRRVTGEIAAAFLQSGEGLGVFESLRTYGDHIFREAEHLNRFQESIQSIQYPYPVKTQELQKELHLALWAYRDRTQVSVRDGARVLDNVQTSVAFMSKPMRPAPHRAQDLFLRLSLWQDQLFVLVGERQHPKCLYEAGVCLKTSPVRRTHTNAQSSQVKTSAYHNAFLASLEVKPEDAYEWVFLDRNGYVTEVRTGNFFMVKRGRLLTPPKDGILNGVTRGVVIECAFRNRLEVVETLLTRHDIYNADEAFLTNTSWEILPAAQLDGRTIGEKIPGPVTLKLQKTFKQIVRKEQGRIRKNTEE